MNNRINLADIQINIMASPQRIEHATKLAKLLNGRTFFDFDQKGCWWNARRCWDFDNDKKYIFVIQDDCLPTLYFKDHLLSAINQKPDHILSFFKGRMFKKGTFTAKENNWDWLLTKCTKTAQAVLIPTHLCKDWLAWDFKTMEQNPKDIDDVHLRVWQLTFKIPNWHTIPDLVEHLGNFDAGQFRSIVWNSALHVHSSLDFNYDLPADHSFTKGTDQTTLFSDSNHIYRIQRRDGKEIVFE